MDKDVATKFVIGENEFSKPKTPKDKALTGEGLSLADFRGISLRGEGSSGCVWSATYKHMPEVVVAIKLSFDQLGSNKKLVDEVEIMAAVNSINVVRLLAYFGCGKRLVIVTELCHQDLYDFIGKYHGWDGSDPIPVSRLKLVASVCKIMCDLLCGLLALEEKGIIHGPKGHREDRT